MKYISTFKKLVRLKNLLGNQNFHKFQSNNRNRRWAVTGNITRPGVSVSSSSDIVQETADGFPLIQTSRYTVNMVR